MEGFRIKNWSIFFKLKVFGWPVFTKRKNLWYHIINFLEIKTFRITNIRIVRNIDRRISERWCRQNNVYTRDMQTRNFHHFSPTFIEENIIKSHNLYIKDMRIIFTEITLILFSFQIFIKSDKLKKIYIKWEFFCIIE